MDLFGRLPSWALPYLKGKPNARSALMELVCLMSFTTNTAHIGYKRLAERMGCSERTAARAIDVLIEVGVISKKPSQRANVYVIHMKGRGMDWDEFETLGEDSEVKKEAPVPKGYMARLIKHFDSELRRVEPNSVMSPTNEPALRKHFKELINKHDASESVIQRMIDLFVLDIERGTMVISDSGAWRSFLGKRAELLRRVKEEGQSVVFIRGLD